MTSRATMNRRTSVPSPQGVHAVTFTGKTVADHTPLVSTLPRAALMLGLEPEVLAAAVDRAGLQEWGRHADGSSVFAWGSLLKVAADAGLDVPKQSGHRWRTRPTIVRTAAKT
jgi:hypothetical protein